METHEPKSQLSGSNPCWPTSTWLPPYYRHSTALLLLANAATSVSGRNAFSFATTRNGGL